MFEFFSNISLFINKTRKKLIFQKMMDCKSTVQLEEISIEKVCRTCLNTSDESMISLYDNYDEEIDEKLNFFQLINETFGRIVSSWT